MLDNLLPSSELLQILQCVTVGVIAQLGQAAVL